MKINSKGICYPVVVKTSDGSNHSYEDENFSFTFNLPHDILTVMVFDSICTATDWIESKGMSEKDFVYDEYFFMATHPETGLKYIMDTSCLYSIKEGPISLIGGDDDRDIDEVLEAAVVRRIEKLLKTQGVHRIKDRIPELKDMEKWISIYPGLQKHYDNTMKLMEADRDGLFHKEDRNKIQ